MSLNRRICSGKAQVALCAMVAGSLAVGGSVASTKFHQTVHGARKSTEPPLPPRGKLGQELFLAIDHRDPKGVVALLKNGADPDAHNGLEMTPLDIAAASHQTDIMKILLQAGANPEAQSTYGTPLVFAAATGNVDGAKLLLSRGVKIEVLRADGMNALMMAANAGASPIVADLLSRKADINAQDDSGATALSLAARNGNLGVGEMLLAAGAAVDLPDTDGQTALMAASITGRDQFVRLLLKNGAKPNARDKKGRTALVLTASSGDYPEVIDALKQAGANQNASDKMGRTGYVLASARGYTRTAAALSGGTSTLVVAKSLREPRAAVNLSLKLLQASMLEFNRSTSCVSCHQEGLGRIATGEAQARGFGLDPAVQTAQKARIAGMMAALRPLHEHALKNPQVMMQLPLIEINEVSTVDAWLLAGMAAQGQPANQPTAAMAMVLARQQASTGCWTFSVPRVPMQSSFFTFTALAVRSLEVYGPKSQSAEIGQRIGRAKGWLLGTQPHTSEDRASRLLGLKWAGADAKDRQQAAAEILAEQRPDGGWSQLPSRESDAYATGQALYALHVGGGIPAADTVYKRGTQFLLRTQDDDGSWFVSKRATPANNFFDAKFPHGESQYASFNGTCWATLALLEAVGPRQGLAAKR